MKYKLKTNVTRQRHLQMKLRVSLNQTCYILQESGTSGGCMVHKT